MDLRDFTTQFAENDFLFEEGDVGDCAYIIESGSVELSIDKGGKILVIATLGEGEVLGEMAIIDKRPRTATARALEETKTIAIPLDYIEQKIEAADPTVRLFLRLVMERYRDIHARLSHVLESMSSSHDEAPGDEIDSPTAEIRNIMSQYMDMQKRITSALSLSTFKAKKSALGEETIKSTRKLVTEEKILKAALKNDEFCVYYQPIVELETGKTVGCEALVRWNHPSGKLVYPAEFIERAETSGLIIDLGYWIAERACQFQSRLNSLFEQTLFVTINLSGKQFDDSGLIQSLADIMDSTGAVHEQIKFEITESLLLNNPELAGEALFKLKETRAKLVIDDFGTGYSSFSYLHRYPFDTMKIDGSFVQAMLRNKKSNEITKSLVNLSHDLGMNVVAECISSRSEAEMLRGYDTEYGQGFYFSKAVAEEAFIKLL
ncbi:MAG: EAL domain-containing protein [Gammaproteobacteria bacterium]|nr:EAL domain-containing protein [Gammaproteobacteria bacterium]